MKLESERSWGFGIREIISASFLHDDLYWLHISFQQIDRYLFSYVTILVKADLFSSIIQPQMQEDENIHDLFCNDWLTTLNVIKYRVFMV